MDRFLESSGKDGGFISDFERINLRNIADESPILH